MRLERTKTMDIKISKVEARNVMGVRSFAAVLNPTLTVLDGPNAAGKTSAITAIFATLAGADHRPDGLLRQGERDGETTVELSDGTVATLKIKQGKTPSLTLKGPDGEKLNKAQTRLNGMFGPVGSFDPLELLGMKPRDQVDVVQQLAGAEYVQALADKDQAISATEGERVIVGRELKKFGQLAVVEPAEPVDTAALAAELQQAQDVNKLRAEALRERQELEKDIQHQFDKVAELRAELAAAEQKETDLRRKLKEMPEPPAEAPTAELMERLRGAEADNERARAYTAYIQRRDEHATRAREYDELDQQIKDLRTERADLARGAELPVDGIEVDDSGIRVDGKALRELSTAEQTKISAKLCAALHPAFRFMVVREGNSLTKASFLELARLAVAEGYQLLVEIAGASDLPANTVHLLAGEVVKDGDPRWAEFKASETNGLQEQLAALLADDEF